MSWNSLSVRYMIPSAHFSYRFILGTEGIDRVICPALFVFRVAEAIAKQQKRCSGSKIRVGRCKQWGRSGCGKFQSGTGCVPIEPEPWFSTRKYSVGGEMWVIFGLRTDPHCTHGPMHFNTRGVNAAMDEGQRICPAGNLSKLVPFRFFLALPVYKVLREGHLAKGC